MRLKSKLTTSHEKDTKGNRRDFKQKRNLHCNLPNLLVNTHTERSSQNADDEAERRKLCKLKFSKHHSAHISQFHSLQSHSFPSFLSLLIRTESVAVSERCLIFSCERSRALARIFLIPSSALHLILFCHFMPLLCACYKHVELSFNLALFVSSRCCSFFRISLLETAEMFV